MSLICSRCSPIDEHPHGLSDRDFDSLFTIDKPIIFNFHGYPWLIHRLAYSRTNHKNLHVRGYKERGNINTPLELAIENEIDRFTPGYRCDQPCTEASDDRRSRKREVPQHADHLSPLCARTRYRQAGGGRVAMAFIDVKRSLQLSGVSKTSQSASSYLVEEQ